MLAGQGRTTEQIVPSLTRIDDEQQFAIEALSCVADQGGWCWRGMERGCEQCEPNNKSSFEFTIVTKRGTLSDLTRHRNRVLQNA